MTSMVQLREAGFDPLLAGQALVPKLMQATARPGTIIPLGELPLVIPPARLRPACALLLAVLDREVDFHVLGPAATGIRDYLRFNTAAHAARVEEADFVLVTGVGAGSEIGRVKRGVCEAPHEGATILYAPTSLSVRPGDAPVTLRLSRSEGLGESLLSIRGVAAEDFDRLQERRDFPMGVNLWLAAADGGLTVLPRSTPWKREP